MTTVLDNTLTLQFPYELRMYNDIHDDLFRSYPTDAAEIIQRSHVIGTIKSQIDPKKGQGTVRFHTFYRDQIVSVELAYMMYHPEGVSVPWVVIMPTYEQIIANFSNNDDLG